jgi:hypothetical protein
MARLAKREGGWMKIWSLKWLQDETLKKIGDSGELAYIRVLCLAGICMNRGFLSGLTGNPLGMTQICSEIRISEDQFNLLIKESLIIKVDGYFYIKNWEKHQNSNVKYKNSIKTQVKVDKQPKKVYHMPKVENSPKSHERLMPV